MDEKYDDITTACANCKILFKIKDMKVGADNKLLCVNCFNSPGSRIRRIK